ncbi:hypothetical protein QQF64_031327 [Cirrhinus molitorella]|uniref:Uncharacterized protein n=2 Tax=Cirrhinus molitorella TaxID=172907 RepID=A0AA88TPF7_9TELE|nr:hypothetical protein Q8A67_010578 [Cirrhinus molitorella]
MQRGHLGNTGSPMSQLSSLNDVWSLIKHNLSHLTCQLFSFCQLSVWPPGGSLMKWSPPSILLNIGSPSSAGLAGSHLASLCQLRAAN